MEHCGWLCKGLTFDAHESHCYFREALMGHFERLDVALLSDIPWFKNIKYAELPMHQLPRLPVRFCLDNGEVIWPLPGSCPLCFYLDMFLLFYFFIFIYFYIYSYNLLYFLKIYLYKYRKLKPVRW